ncbi:SGNH/GDSL hydrolase family protein [Kribbella sandramycini]|uniref:SGNH/GDSL hydrolase family protein n=1 Tax=Kribbella sandramycini TaxID=60450 RepID=A0A7Y4KWD7_9ACTN|nr:SGNH/GDSL hydrolase family protein [Kribbella sandramycini]MBB6567562.1 hypothetical protein [Kribbella sandramycini]NOL39834.1 SGNH/GDSL hydrolase family protein [Kribbella sandramycini]
MRILFVGNSFTARNNLPGLLKGLAAARGVEMSSTLIQAGGASLRQHLNAGKAPAAIADGGYDVVVLQEQSTLPIKSPERFRESAREFDAAIRAAGARTALYLTWARRNAPETQAALTAAYAGSAVELGATLIPVGPVWERFLQEHAEPVLHDKDNSHPALAGSYLAACVFLIALLAEDPVGLDVPVKGLDANTAALLQHSAWDICERLATAE